MPVFDSTKFDNAAHTFWYCRYGAPSEGEAVTHMAGGLAELTQGMRDNLKMLSEQMQALATELSRIEQVVGQIKQIVTPPGQLHHTTGRTPGLR